MKEGCRAKAARQEDLLASTECPPRYGSLRLLYEESVYYELTEEMAGRLIRLA